MGDFRFTHYVTCSWNSSVFAKFNFHFHFLFINFFLVCTVLWGTSILEVNERGMFCFDLPLCLVIFFAIQKSFQEKLSCYAMFCMFFFWCNSGQFSFFMCCLMKNTPYIPKLTIFAVFCGHTLISIFAWMFSRRISVGAWAVASKHRQILFFL
jgi:hypothetical protein